MATQSKKNVGRKREPTAMLKARGNKHLSNDEITDRESDELYAAQGTPVPPSGLDDAAHDLFEKSADYMMRVNQLTGESIYGSEDVEALCIMVKAYSRAIEYSDRESKAKNVANKKAFNSMKNKEITTYERYMRLLKLDPSSRVYRPGLGGGSCAKESIVDHM